MLLEVVILVVSLIVLWWGAELLVDNAVNLSLKLSLPASVIGINIGLLTSFPELIASVIALMNDEPSIVVGNVLGSNIANTTLIIGVCAVIAPLVFNESSFKLSLFVVFLSFVVILMSYLSLSISLLDGIILTLFLVFFVVYLFVSSKKQKVKKNTSLEKGAWYYTFLSLIGTVLLVTSAKFLILSVTSIALSLGITTFFLSLSVIAFGTSLPELITSIVALRKGENDVCIGNVLGSNIYNILFVLGISSLIRPLPIEKEYLSQDFLWFGGSALLCSAFFFINLKTKTITRRFGLVFFVVYFLFIYCSSISAL